jgi:hypothetical protein
MTNKVRNTMPVDNFSEKKAYQTPTLKEIGLIAEKTKTNREEQYTDGGDPNYDHYKS